MMGWVVSRVVSSFGRSHKDHEKTPAQEKRRERASSKPKYATVLRRLHAFIREMAEPGPWSLRR